MAQTGKNRPCPCGSGKKYKLCCMTADEKRTLEAAWRLPQDNPAFSSGFGESRVNGSGDPDIVAWDKEYLSHRRRQDGAAMLDCVNAFFDQHPEKAIELRLEDGPLFDIHEAVVDDNTLFSVFVALLERLRRDFSAVCRENSSYIDLTLIEDAMLRKEVGRLPSLMVSFLKEKESEFYHDQALAKMLALHGDDDLLTDLSRRNAVSRANRMDEFNFVTDLSLTSDTLEFVTRGDTSAQAVSRMEKVLADGQSEISLDMLVDCAKHPDRLTVPAALERLRYDNALPCVFAMIRYFFQERRYSRYQSMFIGKILASFLIAADRKKPLSPTSREIERYMGWHHGGCGVGDYLDGYVVIKALHDFQDFFGAPLNCQSLLDKLRHKSNPCEPGSRLFRSLD